MNPFSVLAISLFAVSERPAAPVAVPRARADYRALWVAVAAVILVVRKTDAFTNPQFWAEDFWPFFVDAHISGPKALLSPYNGYLHLLPRMISWLASALHPSIQPAAYVVASLGVTLLVVAQALSPRLDLPGKPWLALAMVAVPHTGEIFINVTNLQWITALGLVLTLLKRDPENAAEWAVDLTVLVAVGLTGPFSVLLLPLFLVRAGVRRTRASWIAAAVIAGAAAVQAWYLWPAPPLLSPGAWHFSNMLGVLAVRLPMTLAIGEVWPVKLGYAWAVSLGLMLVAGWLFLSVRRGPGREARWFLLAALTLLLVSGIKRVRPDTWAFFDTFNGDRYFYGPKVIALWLVVLVIAELRTRGQRVVGAVIVTLAFAANLPAFRMKPLPDLRWASYSDRIKAGESVEVPINPGWKMVCPAKPPR